MSYCQLIPFIDGKPSHGPEFRNAWGGAARIWTSLFDRYIKNPDTPFHNWMTDRSNALWNLAKDQKLSRHEKAVLAFTFDQFYVRKEHFSMCAHDLRAFANQYPVAGYVDHLAAWADAIENLDAEAVGLYATSVGENLWFRYDSDADECVPVGIEKGHEVYDAIGLD